ncbi:patatin-like phospholipase family protein [Mycolicibacterium lutetiense]|uniref:NTE family protein n=1 Tax=Mycolicibacterium lutetiense TaxID=1641992 RepID=A0ABS4ZM45_9MYCO|nr:patatin-like phospholipase family protein [Mycolicibacterium lutetiense]MBP2450562.1 NTE family protein [Mycolicibacterium lutetiense]
MTSKRALVLAGGGIAGIAWETGILQGIADESPETADALLASDVLVGTSAGSTVSAQLSSGLSLQELFELQVGTTSAELDPGVGIDNVTDLFVKAMLTPNTTRAQKLQGIGAVALSTDTVAAAVRRKVIEARLPSHDWPDRVLRISAIDIDTGELVTLDSESGASLVDAVAASCAVPGVWPVVTIGGRRFMDGGIGSAVNMVLAADCDTAVALVPQGRSTPSPFGAGAAEEVDGFDGRSLGIFADDDALAAFGKNPLDPACRVPSAHAGRAQGRQVAAEVAEFLAG